MNWDQIEGNWIQLIGSARAKWGELTDDELAQMKGHRDELIGKLQERYGVGKEEAERQVDDWQAKL
ncbi:MAG TPA: CsbD family protein [Alphaproteobacteria bacterium]|nr:CsbD family protein [Alphaproteobacteria bacterium]